MNEIERFLKSINFLEYKDEFIDSSVEKVLLNRKLELFQVFIHLKKPLLFSICKNLEEHSSKGINGISSCKIYLSYDSYEESELLSYIEGYKEKLIFEKPSLIGLKETNITYEDNKIIFEVTNNYEKEEIQNGRRCN